MSNKKGLSIKWKLVITILPIVLISIIVIATIITNISRDVISNKTQEQMTAILSTNINLIDGEMDTIKKQSETFANAISGTYQNVTFENYERFAKKMIAQNNNVLGAGIWFEPYIADPEYEYYGPYWMKNMNSDGTWDGTIDYTWDYSNAEYDYFNQGFYLNAKEQSEVIAIITDPYYDESSGLMMASCSAPMKDDNGKFIGCVTVTLQLSDIQTDLANIRFGDSGSIWMIDSSYNYVYHPAFPTAAQDGLNITDSTEMGEYVDKITSNETGSGVFKYENKNRLLYWATIPGMGWKLGLTISESEVYADVNKMIKIAVIGCVCAILVCAIVIILQASSMANIIKKVQKFAERLAEGDFTVDTLVVNRSDEIGAMSEALNIMYENNANVIRNIGDGSAKVSASSNQLSATSQDLLARFEEVAGTMSRVNDAMTNTGAATQQVSASASEVNTSVEKLAEETKKTQDVVVEIEKRAKQIEKDGKESSEEAMRISKERGEELEAAAEQAKVVEKIGTLADSISDIASQINLLSLNASIEAARAGEHGRGFAVVASEINNLAVETKDAVSEIQETVNEIQTAFDTLKSAALDLVVFMEKNVTPDYQKFISIGQQYGEDANTFGELANQISAMVDYISESMEQVSVAVASIAESATETASSSAEVTDNISESSDMMCQVTEMANDSQKVAEDLDSIVKQFNLKEV